MEPRKEMREGVKKERKEDKRGKDEVEEDGMLKWTDRLRERDRRKKE